MWHIDQKTRLDVYLAITAAPRLHRELSQTLRKPHDVTKAAFNIMSNNVLLDMKADFAQFAMQAWLPARTGKFRCNYRCIGGTWMDSNGFVPVQGSGLIQCVGAPCDAINNSDVPTSNPSVAGTESGKTCAVQCADGYGLRAPQNAACDPETNGAFPPRGSSFAKKCAVHRHIFPIDPAAAKTKSILTMTRAQSRVRSATSL